MEKIVTLLGIAFRVTMTFVILWMQIVGIYHSATKHSSNDLILAISLPPYAWHRSIEFFWHEDYSQEELQLMIRQDFRDVAQIFTSSIFDNLNPDLPKAKDNLKSNIKKYTI